MKKQIVVGLVFTVGAVAAAISAGVNKPGAAMNTYR